MINKDDNTEKRILAAARQEFYEKGFAGARMEEIARAAEINKAMLHYYFRSKQKLFEKVFHEAFAQIFPRLIQIILSEVPLDEKIRKISSTYNELLTENPHLPLFVLSSIQRNPENFATGMITDNPFQPSMVMGKFITEIQAAVDAGKISPIDPRDLILNLLAMSVFPFMMKPILVRLFGMSESDYLAFVQHRKNSVAEFAIRAVFSPDTKSSEL
ncbi:MAG: TetR/AcrR family transcriptional regulator [Bacteroidia bacterium]|nr:TetR/AcrR family transcriptional regulator [Bacteroidia bacterium]